MFIRHHATRSKKTVVCGIGWINNSFLTYRQLADETRDDDYFDVFVQGNLGDVDPMDDESYPDTDPIDEVLGSVLGDPSPPSDAEPTVSELQISEWHCNLGHPRRYDYGRALAHARSTTPSVVGS